VRNEGGLFAESDEDLFENAPCGYLSTALDGTILKVNRIFETWTGLDRERLLKKKRFQDLLAGGSRIYHETHYSPLLLMQGEVREIAFELVRADGSRLPALVNSVLVADRRGAPQLIRTMVFDASDRRRYEQELLRAQKREREIAQELQASMLAGELPAAPGLEIAVSHRPAGSELEIGGDWYDAFWLGEGRIALVVGDIVGRGIKAAASMGQLRSATRALASTDLRPGALLEALDAYVALHGVGSMATVVYADLCLEPMELRFACAGHLPPVLALGGEEPRLVWEGRSPPLAGRLQGNPARAEAICPLKRDSLIVLYTDGLVERRGEMIDEGMNRLLEEVRLHRCEPPSTLTASLLRASEDTDHRDDVCLLAASVGDISPPDVERLPPL
jgi:sigma-B regulation protein RsbU (phosphoserine phosphatase)